MENPFVYGRYVTGEAFTDREEELAYLVRELESNGRIFLISPRRYGKSSLLQHARQELLKKGLLVAYFDLYKIATMNQLYFHGYFLRKVGEDGAVKIASVAE